MVQAKAGDTVRVHFTGYLEDGTIFGSTINEEPFEFTIGQQYMLPGFENAIIGMQVGDSKTISLPPEQAYGEYKREHVFLFEREGFPPEIDLQVGKRLQVRMDDGKTLIVTIAHFTDDHIVLDANDPLAGKTLIFKIELVDII